MLDQTSDIKIAVVGLGYVGLPLAVAFSRHWPTLGYDLDATRIEELLAGNDRTLEVSAAALADAANLSVTSNAELLGDCNVFIVTVPTPIDKSNRPDVSALKAASSLIGSALKPGAVIIYESTVYPGATEEVCVPILERASGLRYRDGFHVGYSPERANPGDKTHRLETIVKITSGCSVKSANFVDFLYSQIIEAGTYKAPSIKVAEAAKVIENTQRDLNIALINELAIIFGRMNVDTLDVLEAAGTKWNFLKFTPGLVGGHCIGVDPYYLTHKSQELGYQPDVILAGRRINDGMGAHVANGVIKALIHKREHVSGARILVLGLAFKENCPDIRNTKVLDIVTELNAYHAEVELYDPWVDSNEAQRVYGLTVRETLGTGRYHAIIFAVAHSCFINDAEHIINTNLQSGGVVYDVKGIVPRHLATLRL